MKNLILIAFVAVLSVCSCSSSSYDVEVIDSWKVWVAQKTTGIIYSYWKNNPIKKVDVKNMFPDGVRMENINTKEIITDNEVTMDFLEIAWDECKSILKYKYDSAIKDNNHYVSPRNVVSDWLKNHGLGKQGGRYRYGYKDDEWFINDDESITLLTRACVQSMGTFDDMYKYIHNAVSVYSSSLIEREKQYKLYEVIYHIQYDNVDKYALCNILIQNDGSSEIEIEETSNNLLDLI